MNSFDGPLIEVKAGTRRFTGSKAGLTGVNLVVNRRSVTAVIGRSGSGKSTLLAILGLMDSFESGSHHFNGSEMQSLSASRKDRFRGANVGFVFQRFSLIPHLSALENVLAPLRHAKGATTRADVQRARSLLDDVGLGAMARRRPSQLSGGEQQRVAIARALVRQPALLLADEPTGSLDVDTAGQVMSVVVAAVRNAGSAMVIVTHDQMVASMCDSVFELNGGTLLRVPGKSR